MVFLRLDRPLCFLGPIDNYRLTCFSLRLINRLLNRVLSKQFAILLPLELLLFANCLLTFKLLFDRWFYIVSSSFAILLDDFLFFALLNKSANEALRSFAAALPYFNINCHGVVLLSLFYFIHVGAPIPPHSPK